MTTSRHSGNRAERRRAETLRSQGLDPEKIPPLHRETPPVVGDPVFSARETRRYVGNWSDATLWRRLQEDFPEPDIRVGRRRFWRLSTLERWISSKRAVL